MADDPVIDAGRRGFALNGINVNEVQSFAPRGDYSRRDWGSDCYNREFQGYDHGDYFTPENRDTTFNLLRKDMNL